MKQAIAILTGGGPAPGMNTVVGSVAKTFLAKGYRVIGLHYGYSGLFNPTFSLAKRNAKSASVSVSPRAESIMNFSKSGLMV